MEPDKAIDMDEENVGTFRFTRTFGPLGLSAVLGATVLAASSLRQNGPGGVIVFPIVAFYSGLTAVVFVLPFFAVWPRLRLPSYPLAAVWGVLAAWIVAAWISLGDMTHWEVVALLGSAGALSGLLYSYLAQRRASA